MILKIVSISLLSAACYYRYEEETCCQVHIHDWILQEQLIKSQIPYKEHLTTIAELFLAAAIGIFLLDQLFQVRRASRKAAELLERKKEEASERSQKEPEPPPLRIALSGGSPCGFSDIESANFSGSMELNSLNIGDGLLPITVVEPEPWNP